MKLSKMTVAITLAGQHIIGAMNALRPRKVSFTCWDGGSVYTALSGSILPTSVPGLVWPCPAVNPPPSSLPVDPSVQVLVLVSPQQTGDTRTTRWGKYHVAGYTRRAGSWRPAGLQIIPLKQQLFSRFHGLLESGLLAQEVALVFGLGSGGSGVVHFLVQSGVCSFILVDFDRLEVGNILRHDAGLAHVGRYKTLYQADRIRDKNPYAEVETHEVKITGSSVEFVRGLVQRSSIVVAAVDRRTPKQLINRVCVEEGKPCIFGGAFRRAYGGQVFRFRPGEACYQCHLRLFPSGANEDEVSNEAHAESLGYTDSPVAIEPGLSVDIAPINTMAAKLVVQELLSGKDTTLRSLDEDLSAPWHMYLNRREVGTDYETLPALNAEGEGLRILRWYGIDVDRDPECEVCGDFGRGLAEREGLVVTDEALKAYAKACR